MHRKTTPPAKKQPSLAQMRGAVLRVARVYGVRNVRVVGPFARSDQTQRSDLALLVKMPEGSTRVDLIGLLVDLEEALERRVDVILEESLKPPHRDRILSEARPL